MDDIKDKVSQDKVSQDTKSQDKVFSLADTLKALKDEKKELEDRVDDLKKKIEETDAELSNEMAEQELTSFTHSGSTFYLKSSFFASPVEGKKDEMIKALKDSGNGSLVVEQVNAKTLSSFVKEFRENNKVDCPPFLTGLISTYEKTNVGVRKA